MTSGYPTVEQHLAGIDAAVDRMAVWSRAAGPDAPVPTCPGWTVRDLLAHQGMVHRWATAVVRGDDPAGVDDAALEAEGRATPDPVGWLIDGAQPLVDALRAAPDDLAVMTFLKAAPPARAFWARRQCHETTVHALDALSALEARAAHRRRRLAHRCAGGRRCRRAARRLLAAAHQGPALRNSLHRNGVRDRRPGVEPRGQRPERR